MHMFPTGKQSANMEIRIVDPRQVPGWDEGLKAFRSASTFHTAAWARVLCESYGYKPAYLGAFSGGCALGHLPLIEVSSWLTGRRGVSLPFTDSCEPLYQDAETLRALTDAALRLGKERSWKYVEFRSSESFPAEAPASLTYWEHRVPLLQDEAAQFAALKAPVRTAIRKANNAGVKVEILTSREAVLDFCRLNAMTRRLHGLPPQPRSFFENVQRCVIAQDAGFIVQAAVGGQAVAASMYFLFGDRAIYKYGASDRAFQHLRVNDLVMWTAIRTLAERGCTTLSLGKTARENEGLRRFKLGWGGTETELRYFKHDVAAAALVQDRDAVSGWHNAVFRSLPRSVSELAGRALYRHMA